MISFNIEELIGEFEAVEVQEQKIDGLNAQVKMLKQDNSKRLEDFAKSKETKPKYLKALYKHWKEAKTQDEPSSENDDLYTMMAQLDMYLEKDNSGE